MNFSSSKLLSFRKPLVKESLDMSAKTLGQIAS